MKEKTVTSDNNQSKEKRNRALHLKSSNTILNPLHPHEDKRNLNAETGLR